MTTGIDVPQGVRLVPRFTLEVCEGMTLAQAIANADALTGDWTILLHPGTYNEGDLTPNGGANITIKGMGEGRVTIAPTAAPTTAVIVSAHTLILEDIIVTAPTNAFPALRVTGGTCEACDCEFNAFGAAGDAIQQVGGTLHLNDSEVPIGNVDLSTGACTLTAVDTNFGGTIDTAGAAVAHTITMFNCDLGVQTLGLAATGACAYTFHNCMNMSTITDASLLGTGHLCQCDVVGAGLVVNGTSAWIVDNAGLTAVSNTNAGTIAIYAGVVLAITRAVGSVVWWLDNNTLKVIPSGTITDTVIQWAVAAAGAGDTVVIHPGTYEEDVVLAAGINLKGIDKDNCILNGTAVTLITMAAGCRVSGLTLNATADGGDAIGVELNDVACTIENVYINLVRVDNNAYAIHENVGATARTIIIRNVRILSDINTNEAGIFIQRAGKTIYVEESFIQGGDYAIRCALASTFFVSHSHLEVNVSPPGGGTTISCLEATMYFRTCTIEKQITIGDLGTVRLKNCSYREINRMGTGNCVDESPVLMDAPWKVHRWTWQAALANAQVAVRGNPLDAGTGQVLLQVNTNLAAAEAVENIGEVAGSLGNEFTPARTPRYLTQIISDRFDANQTMFFGLRETKSDDVPAATEDHAGFIWTGAAFNASSDDGGASQTTALTTPTVNVPVQLEVIVFGGVTTVGWVEFYIDGVLVATHATRIPVNGLDWQHLLVSDGFGGDVDIDVTVRTGGCQECPA